MLAMLGIPPLTMALPAAGLALEARWLRPPPPREPPARAIRRIARALNRAEVHQTTLLVFTVNGCSACSEIGMWRASWQQQWLDTPADHPRIVVVGDGDVPMEMSQMVRAGIRAWPCLAIVAPNYVVHKVEVGFRKSVWDRHAAESDHPAVRFPGV